jgi:glycosyltransferase involved in cell wall biosynthesis
MPLHGVETILQAAALLDGKDDLEFRLLGDGPGLKNAKHLANELDLKNVRFLPYVPLKVIAKEIASAKICLGGHFGGSDKANRVIPGKVYQIMAMAKPMIAGDTSANRDLLSHRESALLIPQSNPKALADAILELVQEPQLCIHLGRGAREQFVSLCSENTVTHMLRQIIQEIS